MISDLAYTRKDFFAFNQIRSRSMYLLFGLIATSLYIRDLLYLINVLTPTDYGI